MPLQVPVCSYQIQFVFFYGFYEWDKLSPSLLKAKSHDKAAEDGLKLDSFALKNTKPN